MDSSLHADTADGRNIKNYYVQVGGGCVAALGGDVRPARRGPKLETCLDCRNRP